MRNTRLRNALLTLLAFYGIVGIAFSASDTVRFVACSMTQAIVYGLPTESDRAQALIMRDEVTKVHQFAHTSLPQPGQPPVFCTPGSKMLLSSPTSISVYDVRDRAEQDKIAGTLAKLVAQRTTKPCKLCFFDHENWIVEGNLGMRSSETQLRCVRITADQVQEVSGRKLITYPAP